MKTEIQAIVSEFREYLEELYGGRLIQILLFGSQVRDDAVPGSDIDILVVLKGIVNPGKEIARTGEKAADISLRNDMVISCTFISEKRFNTERSPLLINVRREGVTA
ncbi:MAG TPA: nucleotidyltransferase domain-containing protein [archaeon]|nr:nucleotidyltransferase domain-containing protein [archaeon]